MRTKWGTCSVEARRIWVNLELAKKSVASLEYVVIHELVHLLAKHHDDHFVAIMDKHLPRWRALREELNCIDRRRIQHFNVTRHPTSRWIVQHLTANLNEATNFWERELGLPQVGVSNQAEGVAVGKNLSWGSTEKSARSIIILTDMMAAAAMAGNALAVTALAHELGHVHDEFARGVAVGFPKSHLPPDARNWPKVSAYIANMVWGEYAAESIGTPYMRREDLRDCMLNDPIHVAGVHGRLRQSIWNYKCRGQDLVSLWSGSITAIGDIFANLGRATARLRFVENSQEALARLVSLPNGAARWKPVIERLDRELRLLRAKHYSDWGAEPFRGIQETVALGFEAAGLFPTHGGPNIPNVASTRWRTCDMDPLGNRRMML